MTLDSGALDLGAIFGTSGTADFYRMAAETSGVATSYFGNASDPSRNDYAIFQTQILQPIQRTEEQFALAKVTVDVPNVIRPLTSIEDLKQAPPCMHIPIIMYAPIRQLLEDERIDGYGYDPKSLPKEDVYDRLINNGKVVLYPGSPDLDEKDPNVFYTTTEERSTDPILSFDDVIALETTRNYLDTFLTDENTEYLDPTNPLELKG